MILAFSIISGVKGLLWIALHTSCCWVDGRDFAQRASDCNRAHDGNESAVVNGRCNWREMMIVAYKLKNRQGAPPVVNAVATTLDSASQVAIKQRHRLPSDHIE